MDSGTSKGMIEAENGSVLIEVSLATGVTRASEVPITRLPANPPETLNLIRAVGGALVGLDIAYTLIMSILCIAMKLLVQCHIPDPVPTRFRSGAAPGKSVATVKLIA